MKIKMLSQKLDKSLQARNLLSNSPSSGFSLEESTLSTISTPSEIYVNGSHTHIQALKEQLAENELESVFEQLMKTPLLRKHPSVHDQLVILKRQWKILHDKSMVNMMTSEDYIRENEIINSLLNILNRLKN
ncbi:MAG: hypothetical protein AAFV78_19355 [Bacteroidota bacterium]